MGIPNPVQAAQTITLYYDAGNAVVGTYDNASSTVSSINNSESFVDVLSNFGQLGAAIASINPATGVIGNVVAVQLTFQKGMAHGELSAGDWLSLGGNLAGIIGGALAIGAASPFAKIKGARLELNQVIDLGGNLPRTMEIVEEQ